jgi:hypothetical protein
VTITCEEPSISEVFESIDISKEINVPIAVQSDDTKHAVNSTANQQKLLSYGQNSPQTNMLKSYTNGASYMSLSSSDKSTDSDKSDDDNGVVFDELYQYYGSDKSYSDDGKVWEAYAGAGENASFTIETDNFSKKEGVYAQSVFSLTLLVDFLMTTKHKEISTFILGMEIDSTVDSTLGFHKSADTKEQRVELPSTVVPLCGPLVMDIKPYLVARASGEISIEATASFSNYTGFWLTNENGLEPLNYSDAQANFNASAEGSIEGGMGVYMDMALVGLNFFDDMEIAYADAAVGIVVDGSTSVSQSISFNNTDVNYSGNQNTPDEQGRLHKCYVCVEGECNSYIDLALGLNKKLEEMLQKVNDKIKLSYTFDREKYKLFDWHCSTGDGYTLEFEYKKCPHVEYEVDVTIVEKGTFAPISGVEISIGNQDKQTTDSAGSTIWYLPNGDYTVNAYSEECDPDTVTDSFKISDEREYITLEMVKAQDLYYPYIRDVLIPELGLFEVGTADFSFDTKYIPYQAMECWDGRRGIVSACVTDLDGDKVNDMLLLTVEDGMSNYDYYAQELYIYVYTIENGEVVCKGREQLDEQINTNYAVGALMVYTNSDDCKKIWYESYYSLGLADYSTPYYVSYRYEDGQLIKEMSAYQTEGGSSGNGYSLIDEQTGESTLFWKAMEGDDDTPGIYNNVCNDVGEAFQKALVELYGMPETEQHLTDNWTLPSWQNKSKVVARLNNDYDSDYSNVNAKYHFTMTYEDATDLRGRLEQLEDN